tara:strand:- start:651 stop:803 length:153 start_codon:yes stop_codon:yes gene_type:complete
MKQPACIPQAGTPFHVSIHVRIFDIEFGQTSTVYVALIAAHCRERERFIP